MDSRTEPSVQESEVVLDQNHHGLKEVKQRIIEFLAVRQLRKSAEQKQEMRGSIICLVGPPGTGKTSLTQSIAEALQRSFARITLGGITDESEIRGHRKAYVGA